MRHALLTLADILTKAGVANVLVGGGAAYVHGSPMMTQDINLACDMSVKNQVKLQAAIAHLNPMHRMAKPPRPFTAEEAAKGTYKDIYLQTDYGQLDCLGEVKGIGTFDACWAESEEIEVRDFQLRVLTLDSLIRAKRAMTRPRDKQNAMILEAIRDGRDPEGIEA